MHHGQPVISVDAKKFELIGDFKNAGTRACRTADVVSVGTHAVTAELAVAAIRRWWTRPRVQCRLLRVVRCRGSKRLVSRDPNGG